jgi:D-glycero-D-manno-heptose 1,7-bisphosphate phosphatase
MPPDRRPGLLLDRDGVLNVEVHRLHRIEDLVLVPGVLSALAEIARWNVAVAVVSNQAGIGHGLYDDAACRAVNEELGRQVAAAGGRIDAFFYCPHTPAAGCACRKPAPGLLHQAAEALALDLTRSVLVGDKRSDLEAARAAGCAAVLVRSGYGQAEESSLGADPRGATLFDACVDSLADAVPVLARMLDRPDRSPINPRS